MQLYYCYDRRQELACDCDLSEQVDQDCERLLDQLRVVTCQLLYQPQNPPAHLLPQSLHILLQLSSLRLLVVYN